MTRKKLGRVCEFKESTITTTVWNLHLRRRGNTQERAQVEALRQRLALIVDEEGPDYWHWDLDKGEWLLAWPKRRGEEITNR
ncbi:hypothetical protein FRX31_027810, partial [Thalictrum thalictroides]